MLSPNTYTKYLETLVLSLLDERNNSQEIISTDKEEPSFKNCTFAPQHAKDEIYLQRMDRKLQDELISTATNHVVDPEIFKEISRDIQSRMKELGFVPRREE